MIHRRGKRGFRDGFGVIWGAWRHWRRACGLGGAEYRRAVAGEGHALCTVAAHQPAEAGAQAKQPAQDMGVPVGILGGVGGEGEEPVLVRAAHGVARDGRDLEGGEQGQQQELQRGRNPGVQNRLRQGAQGIGFARCGGLMWHHQEFQHMQYR